MANTLHQPLTKTLFRKIVHGRMGWAWGRGHEFLGVGCRAPFPDLLRFQTPTKPYVVCKRPLTATIQLLEILTNIP